MEKYVSIVWFLILNVLCAGVSWGEDAKRPFYEYPGDYRQQVNQLKDNFKTQFGISLDPIYTGKMFFGIFVLVEKGYFEEGSSVVAVHTGGLQGVKGFRARYGDILL